MPNMMLNIYLNWGYRCWCRCLNPFVSGQTDTVSTINFIFIWDWPGKDSSCRKLYKNKRINIIYLNSRRFQHYAETEYAILDWIYGSKTRWRPPSGRNQSEQPPGKHPQEPPLNIKTEGRFLKPLHLHLHPALCYHYFILQSFACMQDALIITWEDRYKWDKSIKIYMHYCRQL